MKHILIVEDDAALREGLTTALTGAELTADAASDCAEARRKFGNTRFDFSELIFSADGQRVFLSAAEQKLLAVFCAHKGRILDRQTLTARFDLRWTAEAVGNILDNAVK